MPDTSSRRVWIASPRYDLPIITLAPLAGLVICAISRLVGETTLVTNGFIEANFFLIGMPHYLSTYTFYMGDENLAHYRTRKLLFFIGPFLVIGAMLAAFAAGLVYLVAVVVVTWNTYHVSRQSSGILSVYRHRAGGNNEREKWPALFALVGSAFGFFLLNVDQRILARILGGTALSFVHTAAFVLLIVAAIAAVRVASLMTTRGAAAAEWVFLGSSLLLFTPYVLIHDVNLATTAVLSGHYIQYLGVLWLINRRKYTEASGSIAQRTLHTFSSHVPATVVLLVSVSLISFGIDRLVHRQHWMAFHTVWLNAVILLHFYLDGLFWAFKDPYTRRSLSPFLVRYEPGRPAAPAPDVVASAI